VAENTLVIFTSDNGPWTVYGDHAGSTPYREAKGTSFDGGVRSGTDLFKALALGARGALIGRGWIWALAGAGEAGLRDYLDTVQRELRLTMTLAGVTRTADIDACHLDSD
ncbi:MAG TPA: alpha-hydroxy-acid oxidizing protein, partial [Chiayiivirga sp.]|nr:alpha-hydroxy-acid oxidizing protein [Chiayiivirga sp.]